MKYTIIIIACLFLFVGCKKSTDSVQPTGSLDTLGIHWTVVEKTNIIYYFQDYSTQSSYASQYITEHESGYTQIAAVFQPKLPQKLRFFIWTDSALALQLLGEPLGFAVPEQCVCNVRPDETIGHLMTDVLSYWAWGIKPISITRFVNEGVGVAFDLSGENRIQVAKAAIAGQNVTSVQDLWANDDQVSESVLYPVAGAFMNYLYQLNQPAHFDSLVKNQTIASAQAIYGSTQLDSLFTSFNTQLGL